MTTDEARQRVAEIENIAGDDERAHSDEDKLRAAALAWFRDGIHDAPSWVRELSDIVLSTDEIEFARWCA